MSTLLSLPYELRQKILQHALRQKGTVELQHPVWAELCVFAQPLFQVCRSLRDEALEAFYESNDFLWILDAEHKSRSDPSKYPAPASMVHRGIYIHPETDPPLKPCLPWEYPDLMKHLRRLQINVYLPQDRDATTLKEHLVAVVLALDCGRRLKEFHVLITAKRRAAHIPLTLEERKALGVLAGMEVRGNVAVQTRYYFRAVDAGVRSLDLQRRMKAS